MGNRLAFRGIAAAWSVLVLAAAQGSPAWAQQGTQKPKAPSRAEGRSEPCADCGGRPQGPALLKLPALPAQAQPQSCLDQLSLHDLKLISGFEAALGEHIQTLFRNSRKATGTAGLQREFALLQKAGAQVDPQGQIGFSRFQFESLQTDAPLREAFLKVFPSAKNRIRQIADPRRKEVVLIEGWALLPPYLRVAAPGQKFTAAMPLHKYRETLTRELQGLDSDFRDLLKESARGGTVGELANEVSAFWTHDAWGNTPWEREHEAGQRAASAMMFARVRRLAQKWGMTRPMLDSVLESLARVNLQASHNRDEAVQQLLEKSTAITISPLLAPIAAVGWLPALGFGVAFTGGDAVISAGIQTQARGGDFACQLAKQLDRKAASGFLTSLLFAPTGGLGKAAHSSARVLGKIPVKALASVGLGTLTAAGYVQTIREIPASYEANRDAKAVGQKYGKTSEVARAAVAESREAATRVATNLAFALLPVTEIVRMPDSPGLLHPVPTEKIRAPRLVTTAIRRMTRSEPGVSIRPDEAVVHLDSMNERFSSGMEADLTDPSQALVFDMYRVLRFGSPSTKLAPKTFEKLRLVLLDHPELARKEPFRDIRWVSREVSSPVPESLRKFVKGSLASAHDLISKLYQVDANIGFWRKILQDEGNLVAHFPLASREYVRNSRVSPIDRAGVLYSVLERRRLQLESEGKTKEARAISQVIVNLIHTVGYLDPVVTRALGSSQGRDVLSGFRKVLEMRDSFAMSLGFDGHFAQVLADRGIPNPAGVASEKKLPLVLEALSTEVEASVVQGGDSTLDTKTIRQLSTAESPFRSCVGGSDCSSRTYLTRALDPNYHYFTMTNAQGLSSGQVTVVLGTGKVGGQAVKVAFIDKLQNVPNHEIRIFLEGVRQSLAEKGYVLALPEDLGGHNGLSNDTLATIPFVAKEVAVDRSRPIQGYSPHRHSYSSLDSNYSRAEAGLLMHPVLPLPAEQALVLQPGAMPSRQGISPDEAEALVGALRKMKDGDERAKLGYLTDRSRDMLERMDPDYQKTILAWVADPTESIKVRKKALFKMLEFDPEVFFKLFQKHFTGAEKAELLDQIFADSDLCFRVVDQKWAGGLIPILRDPAVAFPIRRKIAQVLLVDSNRHLAIEDVMADWRKEEVQTVLTDALGAISADPWELVRMRYEGRQISSPWTHESMGTPMDSLLALTRKVPELRDQAIQLYLLPRTNGRRGPATGLHVGYRPEELNRILDDPALGLWPTKLALTALELIRSAKSAETLLAAHEIALDQLPRNAFSTRAWLIEEFKASAVKEKIRPKVFAQLVLWNLGKSDKPGASRELGLELVKAAFPDGACADPYLQDVVSIARLMAARPALRKPLSFAEAIETHFKKQGSREDMLRFFRENRNKDYIQWDDKVRAAERRLVKRFGKKRG